MSDPDVGSGRDVEQALVAATAVLALVVATALVPALTVPFGAPPDEGQGDARPGNGTQNRAGTGGTGSSSGGVDGSTGRLAEANSLSPGQRTDVGGPMALGRTPNGTNATHFVVESDRASYWRTGAYGRYTGDGWERLEDPSLYTGALPAPDGKRLHQTVTLYRPATGLPAAWRPTRIDVEGSDPTVFVTDQGAMTVRRGVPAGTTYEVTSYVDQPSPAELRDAGRDYPESVDRYRRLPDETPTRMYSFGDRITSDADGPYESAVAVERWLESNKEYRLNVSSNESRPLADQFVFEMDAGYCEYFATTMAVVLRTQGIPARYVVGYAPGTKVGNDTYRVRSLDAHAWVEVYFPDHGWVRFDPTPARERRAVERGMLARAGVGSDHRPAVDGSPGGGGGWIVDGSATSDPAGLRGPPYQVELDQSPVPGADVTVTVTKDGLPVAGAIVTFDGDPVGRTDRNGEVVATVPYTDSLRVDAKAPWSAEKRVPTAGYGAETTGDRRVRSIRPATVGPLDSGAGVAPGDAPETYDVPTNVTFSIRGTPAEGRSFVLVPAIHGEPIADATVTFAGRRVGRTNASGARRIDVARDAPDPAVVRVERGEVAAETRIDLRELHVRVIPHTLLPLPNQGATAVVTVGDRRVSNATVSVDGEVVGRTGEEGRVAFAFPNDEDARVEAVGPVQSDAVTVRGIYGSLFALLALLVGVLAVGVAVPVTVFRRREHALAEAPGLFLSTVADALAATWRVLVRVGARVRDTLVRSGLWIARAAISLAIVVGRIAQSIAGWSVGALAAFAAVVRSSMVALGGWIGGASLGSVLTGVASLPGRGVGALARGIRFCWLVVLGVPPFTATALDDAFGTATDGSTGDPTGGATPGGSPLSVREAWRAFLRVLGPDEYRTMTPGEVARAAEGRGLPAGPVSVLTEAFRAVEYGGREEDRTLRERVTAALGALVDREGEEADVENANEGGADEGPGPSTTGTGGDD